MPAIIGIPIKLIHEAEGHVITVELNNGETFRGQLNNAEDSMNLHMKFVTATATDGRITTLNNIYIRGSHIHFIIFPDMCANAPMFVKIANKIPTDAGLLGIGRGARVQTGTVRGAGMRAGYRGK